MIRFFSGSVSRQMRKLPVLLQGALLLAAVTFASPASAEVHPQGLGDISPHALGALVIVPVRDSILPLPDQMRSFESKEAYLTWVQSTLNFQEKDAGMQANIITAGQAFAYNEDLTELVPVEDPIATFIGGRSGYVQIGEDTYCVNAERCSNAVDPYALGALVIHPAIGQDFDKGRFSAEVTYLRSAMDGWDPVLGAQEHARAQATTVQASGGFEIVAWNQSPEPKLVCDALLSGLEESNCYWVPVDGAAWIETTGSNELSVELRTTGKVEDQEGFCYSVEGGHVSARATDVSRLTVQVESYGWANDPSPSRFGNRPTSLRALHEGKDGSGSGNQSLRLDTDIAADCS